MSEGTKSSVSRFNLPWPAGSVKILFAREDLSPGSNAWKKLILAWTCFDSANLALDTKAEGDRAKAMSPLYESLAMGRASSRREIWEEQGPQWNLALQ